ncbi:MAG: AMP-binding protein, partial [Gemmatimonas sp.]|nr:AMP-binding protein [Gemmatimonas sp.]
MSMPEQEGPGIEIFDNPVPPPAGMPPQLERLTDYIPYHAAQVPNRPCLVAGEMTVTWGELPDLLDCLSKGMLANDVARGDRVAVWTPPTIEGVLLFMACAQIGAMFVGINPKYKLDEIQHVLSDSDPKLLFSVETSASRDYSGELQAIEDWEGDLRVVRFAIGGADLIGDTGFDQEGTELPDAELEAAKAAVEPSDPVTIVYTSGTTGTPKGALLTSQGFAINYWHVYAERYIEWLRVPAFFTINHQAGLGDVAALAIVSGGTQYPMERFDTRELLELVEREKITYLPGLVTNFQLLFRNENVDDFDLSSLEYIWWGGALIPIDLLNRLLELAPRASTDFGQTETTGPLIYTPVDASLEDKSLTIGRPMWPFEVRLADEKGKPPDPGEAGEIQ